LSVGPVDAELLWGHSEIHSVLGSRSPPKWGPAVGPPVAAQMAGQRIRSLTDIARCGASLLLQLPGRIYRGGVLCPPVILMFVYKGYFLSIDLVVRSVLVSILNLLTLRSPADSKTGPESDGP
jgi:hypothetical protein